MRAATPPRPRTRSGPSTSVPPGTPPPPRRRGRSTGHRAMADAQSILAVAEAEGPHAEAALDAHYDTCDRWEWECADCRPLAAHAERCARQVALLALAETGSEALF